MAEIKIRVEFEAEGIWCDEATWHRIPPDFREKFRAWNWWWELGQYRLCADGVFSERNPDFDHEECAWIGLCLSLQLKQAMPDDRVIFVHEAEWNSAFAKAQESGQGYDFPDSHCVYEIFAGPDRIEARRVQEG